MAEEEDVLDLEDTGRSEACSSALLGSTSGEISEMFGTYAIFDFTPQSCNFTFYPENSQVKTLLPP